MAINNGTNLRQLAQAGAVDNQNLAHITEETRKDSRTMRIATLIAMAYLPANLVTVCSCLKWYVFQFSVTYDSEKYAVFLQYELGEFPIKRTGLYYDFRRTHASSPSGMDSDIHKFFFSSRYHGCSRFGGSVWAKAASIKVLWWIAFQLLIRIELPQAKEWWDSTTYSEQS
jgi:hypothetical protein